MLTRSKYKEESAICTINKVKKIIASLGLEIEIEMVTNTGSDCSCRLRIRNGFFKNFDIGVNGKGMNIEFAQASAFAELMERLQNKALIMDNVVYATKRFLQLKKYPFLNGPTLDFLYFPDEEEHFLSPQKIEDEIIPKFFPSCKLKNSNKKYSYPCIFAPFEELTEQRKEMIPVEYYRAMCGTTGLCAGNSRNEAIVQGINEIFERYVLMMLYTNQPNLPQIDLSLFRGHEIYNRLIELEKKFVVIIRDCSLGMGIPVLGLLLINRSSGTYAFRLGADFNMITALERCYTESFQGKNSNKYIFKGLDIKKPQDFSQYKTAVKNGRGRFPHCVLTDNGAAPHFPHYDFHSYKEELTFYIDFLRSLHLKLYVKDNSFLGFPAYAVYIPGISFVSYPLFDFNKMIEKKRKSFGKINALLNIKDSIKLHTNEIIDNLGEGNTILQKWNTARSAIINSQLLGMYVLVAKRKYRGAIKMIEALYANNISHHELRCAYDILNAWEKGMELDIIRIIYGDKLVDVFLQQFKDVLHFFDIQPFPQCFQCGTCPLKKTCYYKEIIIFEKNIQTIQSKYYGYFEG